MGIFKEHEKPPCTHSNSSSLIKLGTLKICSSEVPEAPVCHPDDILLNLKIEQQTTEANMPAR